MLFCFFSPFFLELLHGNFQHLTENEENMSAEIVVNALKDLASRKDLDRYDPALCADIHKRLESKLAEKNYSITEKTVFVNKTKKLISYSFLLKAFNRMHRNYTLE